MIRVLCPSCGRRFRTERRAIGVTAVCSGCGETFQIGEKLAPFEWEQKDLAEDSWIGVEPPKEEKELKHCFQCEAPMEADQVICPSCGVNQVTGVIHKPKTKLEDHNRPILSAIPLRFLAVLAVVVLFGGGIYWIISMMAQSVITSSENILAERPIYEAAAYLRKDGDHYLAAKKYAGTVTDNNLPHAIKKLSAENQSVRQAAIILIGCGHFDRLDVLVNGLREKYGPKIRQQVLNAIGPKRLLQFSIREDPKVRSAAADALAMLFDLADQELQKQLAEAMPLEDKTVVLNEYCRTWPLLAGTFVIQVNESVSPFQIEMQQYGTMFYLLIHGREFRSNQNGEFTIPVEHWCAATSPVVDARQVAQYLEGDIHLSSQTGAEWKGTVKLTVRRDWPGELPGFLPFDSLAGGQSLQKPILLKRPDR